MATAALPIAVIGAGPVGLAAAAHLVSRGEIPVVLEAGTQAGAAVRAWGHVRVFSPWRYNVDPVVAAMLAKTGWTAPDPDRLPTGQELVDEYLAPLAALPEIGPSLRLSTRVMSVSRRGFDKLRADGRDVTPFVLRILTAGGEEEDIVVRAVIDASGTYGSPNPLGADGTLARGERLIRDRAFYGIPDVLGARRDRYAGRRVAVIGSGHSALNTLLDLAELRVTEPETEITWIVRRPPTPRVFGGGAADALPARAALGQQVLRLLDRRGVVLTVGRIAALTPSPGGVTILDGSGSILAVVDELVAVTGFRPDLDLSRELRLDLDPAMEAPRALAPLIDPNVHSCGTVPPHGAAELAHPEPGFYVVGMKSYGRAPTFLMLTGYEQVRSIACALTGDVEGARRVELMLPATGVCSAAPSAPGILAGVTADPGAACCGGPAPANVDACCVQDAEAKAVGQEGCGCGSASGADAVVAGEIDVASSGGQPGTRSGPGGTAPRIVPLSVLRQSPPTSSCCSQE
jgi:hypothetical protein